MSRRLASLVSVLLATAAVPGVAAAATPVVVELFTSQSCSSCPPADAFLAELARTRPDVLALDFHVTYWNGGGWRDPFSLAAATERQRRYAARFGDGEVYTPEMVIDGTQGVVGSDRGAALARIASVERSAVPADPLRLSVVAGGGLAVSVAGAEGTVRGDLLLVGFDPSHDTSVGGGENGGRRLHEVDVVRSLRDLGSWAGAAVTLRVPRPAGERSAVLLQAADGRILGAAVSG